MTFKELKAEIENQEIPSWSRYGQFVFNYIDETYGVAREVQYEYNIDCFYRDDLVDDFLEICAHLITKRT